MVLIFTNDNALANHTIYPVGGPWWVFNHMRILAGVQVIEDMIHIIGISTCFRNAVKQIAEHILNHNDSADVGNIICQSNMIINK